MTTLLTPGSSHLSRHYLASGPSRGGRRHGRWQWWHDVGRLQGVGEFHEGLAEGLWTFYYANGLRDCEGEYRRGRREGLWTFWWPNGRLQALGVFDGDLEDGHWVYWREDGEREEEGCYQRGVKVGVWRSWPADGAPCHEVHYAPPRGALA